jgi:hypothetical protein
MKTSLILFVLLIGASAAAQSRTNENNLSTPSSQHGKSGIVSLAPVTAQVPAEIKHGRLTYSGPVVSVAKTKNPLDLFNPYAPTESNGEIRVSHDLLTDRPNGVRLFTIRF